MNLKKFSKYQLFTALAAFLINLVLIVIICVSVKKEAFEQGYFWLNLLVGVVLEMICVEALIIYDASKPKEALLRVPMVLISYGFSIVLAVFALISILSKWDNTTAQVIIYLIIYVAYILLAIYAMMGTKHIEENNKVVKQKVFFIRDLSSKLDVATGYITDSESIAAVKKLSEEIRFSDPMSNDITASYDEEIEYKVNELLVLLENNQVEEIKTKCNALSIKLKMRNAAVRNSK